MPEEDVAADHAGPDGPVRLVRDDSAAASLAVEGVPAAAGEAEAHPLGGAEGGPAVVAVVDVAAAAALEAADAAAVAAAAAADVV